jgi:hypothetical protein
MTLWGTIFWLVPDWGAYDDAAFHAFWDFPRCKNSPLDKPAQVERTLKAVAEARAWARSVKGWRYRAALLDKLARYEGDARASARNWARKQRHQRVLDAGPGRAPLAHNAHPTDVKP